MARTVAVIGGGISGLAAAWELSRPGAEVVVTLLEGSDRVGGKLRLEDVGGVRIDVGAESVLARRPEALALFEELGISDRTTHPAAVGASIGVSPMVTRASIRVRLLELEAPSAP